MDSGPADSEILRAAGALGMLGGGPDAAHRLLTSLCNPGLGLRQVNALITRDPGLTARVLKVSNSSFYGRARNVDTVERAVSVLGLDAVRGIAAAACLDRALPAGAKAPLDISRLVQHSVATALAAEQLARPHHPELTADAFIAGLLHDLGAVIQARVDPTGFRSLIEALRVDPTLNPLDLEGRCVSVSQERCARIIFVHWQLPESLLEATCHYSRPGEAPVPHIPLAALVHLGNRASLLAGQGWRSEVAPGLADPQAMAQAGVADSDVQKVADELSERVSHFLTRLS